jgi:hypothetical protein
VLDFDLSQEVMIIGWYWNISVQTMRL